MKHTNAILAALVALVLFLGATHAQETPAKQRITLFDLPVTGNANVLSSSLTPSSLTRPSTTLRISVAIKPGATDSVCKVVVVRGAVSFALSLNSATALTAGNLYTFTWGIGEKTRDGTVTHSETALSWNVQFATSTTLAYLDVQEVQIP